MTTYFEYNEGRKPMGDVIPFEKPEREIEHIDSTTMVEKIEMTPELKKAFEDAGYNMENAR